jgi:hypothetical protein
MRFVALAAAVRQRYLPDGEVTGSANRRYGELG